MQILHLHSHRLVIIDKRSLLLSIQPYLLDQVFSRRSLIRLLLTKGKSLVCLDKLPFSVDNDSLELVPLTDQLLAICINLLLQLKVLFQESVPLSLALPLPSLMFLQETPLLAELLALSLKDVREMVGILAAGTRGSLHCTFDPLTKLHQLVLLALALTSHLVQLSLEQKCLLGKVRLADFCEGLPYRGYLRFQLIVHLLLPSQMLILYFNLSSHAIGIFLQIFDFLVLFL